MSDMRIGFGVFDEILPLKKLKPSRFQRNKHSKDQIERLAKIMKESGVRQPIHISKLTGEVCFGHGRWEAAKRVNGPQTTRTKRILNRKSKSKSGSSPKEMLQALNSNISIAMGFLATLSLRQQSAWIKKYGKTDPEHLRILLLEVMEEIYSYLRRI
jgi:hypothetical protein